MGFFDFIALPMGQFLNFIYNTMAFRYYGLAIIIFTLFIRLVLLPLYVKQYRSTSKMQLIQPQIQEIQKRYKNDKEKLNQEMMKVYQENKVNPAGGCLPLLIQMPILFSLYYAISQPLHYMLGKKPEVITQLLEIVKKDTTYKMVSTFRDINIINYFTQHKDKLSSVSGMLKSSDLLNMHFLGLNLGLQPTYQSAKLFSEPQYIALLLIPILAAITTFLSVKLSSPQAGKNAQGNQMTNSMTNSMTMIMPFMTAFFAFSVPAGMGFYWTVSNIVQILQQMYMNKYVIKKKDDPVAAKKELSSEKPLELAMEPGGELPKGGSGNSSKNSGAAAIEGTNRKSGGPNKNSKKRR